jgi:hypothetical protein
MTTQAAEFIPGKGIRTAEVRTFTLFGQSVPLILADNGFVYIKLEAICQLLQLDIDQQVRSINSHSFLQTGLAYQVAGEMVEFSLRVDFLALWLTHLHPEDLPHIRRKEEIEGYQQEAALVLAESFLSGRLTHWPLISRLLEQNVPTVRVYKESLALVSQARERLIEETQMRLPPEFHV